jgi:RNA polymerase sigma factor (sigma-70 family)
MSENAVECSGMRSFVDALLREGSTTVGLLPVTALRQKTPEKSAILTYGGTVMRQLQHVPHDFVDATTRVASQDHRNEIIKKCFVEHGFFLCRLLTKHGIGRADAEDLVQSFFEKWLAMGEKTSARPRKGRERAWLARGVFRHACSVMRSRRIRAAAEERYAANREVWHASLGLADDEAELKHAFKRILSECASERMRCAFELWFRGYSCQRIADEMGISLRTVQVAMKRTRERLCRELLRLGFSLPRTILVRSAW